MKVFIAGSTGVLGRRLVRQFLARGHSVLGLVRSEEGEEIVRSIGAEPCRADIFDPDSLRKVARGSDAVVHAATSIPLKVRLKASDWLMNDKIRRDGTKALATCAGKIGAKLFLLESIVWLARPVDGSSFDEETPANPDNITRSMLEGEQIARGASEKFGFKLSVLRCGLFYSSDASHTRLFGDYLLRRRLPVIGKGDAVWSLLHLDDAAEAFVTVAEAGRAGLWNVVDDKPVAVTDFLRYFARSLNAPPPRSIPAWLARIIAGKYAVSLFTQSVRTSNSLFRNELGWVPRFPSYKEGLDEVVEMWKSEGFPGLKRA